MSADALNPQQFHEMSRSEFESQPDTWFHGTPTGVINSGNRPFHVGTHRAAKEAVGSRMAYGNPTVGQFAGHGDPYLTAMEASRRSGKSVRTSDSTEVAPDPKIIGGRIVGPMSNMPQTDPRPNIYGRFGGGDYQGRHPYAYGDYPANGMQGRLKHQGVYYKNVGEDEDSISAILPKRSHFKTHEDYLVEAREQGKVIPKHATEGYTEIPGQQKMVF